MNNILLSPPAAFLITLVVMIALLKALSALSFKPKSMPIDAGKSYACGEDVPTNLIQPDYSQFFPFAFFFTILHVFTLIIVTVPPMTLGTFIVAAVYIIAAITGLVILFRR